MARVYSYRKAKSVLAAVCKVNEFASIMNRIPDFVLKRCGIEVAEDLITFKELCKKYPLFFEFALSRFIGCEIPGMMVMYYIPSSQMFVDNEYSVYYYELYPYDKLESMILQDVGFYEIYMTQNSERDVYNLYCEDIKHLRLCFERFRPTDVLLGSVISEQVVRINKRNYTSPNRKDPFKLEIKISDLEKTCDCLGMCNICWIVLAFSYRYLDMLIESRLHGVPRYAIFNGMDGYIVYFNDSSDETKQGISDVVNEKVQLQRKYRDILARDFQILIEVIPRLSEVNIDSDFMPNFHLVEYNSYTRLPYSVNSNTKKLCIPMSHDIYKIWYRDLPTVYDVLKNRERLLIV